MDATKMATTAALAEMESPIKYSQLEEIEDQFEDVELKIIRQQDELTRDLYTKRQKIVSQIPGFWPLVFEQAPADIDEFVTPDDSNILLNALDDLFVERFELPGGDPRSLLIRFTFKENEWFENKTLEKKFWWRHAKDGWAGYVSEPVEIQWKSAEKDATHGVLSLAKKLFEEDKAGKGKEDTETKKEYKKLIEGTGYAGVSFFSWFGFRGRKISEEENVEAKKIEEEKRAKRAAGQDEEDDDDMEEDEEDEDEDEYEFEIFPTGDDLAVAIAEDLWPSAIKMFTDAQEAEMIGELGLDDDEEDSDDDEDEEMGDDETPNKKRKA